MRILVFDTETTGLPAYVFVEKNMNRIQTHNVAVQPHILQLSYILFDTKNTQNTKLFDKYVDLPTTVAINEEAAKVHHITHTFLANQPEAKKMKIDDLLNEFLFDAFNNADIIVAHNMQFDSNMIVTELVRLKQEKQGKEESTEHYNELIFKWFAKPKQCTMQMSKNTVKALNKLGHIKMPRLAEANNHYFQPILPRIADEILHNSIYDAVLCLRIYIKINYDQDIVSTLAHFVLSSPSEEQQGQEQTNSADLISLAKLIFFLDPNQHMIQHLDSLIN